MKEKIYIGGYSNSIKICEFNNGKLKIVNEKNDIINPSYLHINKQILYAVCETDLGSITSYRILDNDLEKINTKEIYQDLPCYIATDKQRKNLLIANYGSGSIIEYNIKKDGSIGMLKDVQKYTNSNMHYVDFIEDDIYAIDLGNDSIYIYNSKMKLVSQINTNKKTGPRHMVMTNDKQKMYVVTELSNQVLVYKRDESEFKLVQQISTLPNQKIKSFAGAIRISSNNKNVYVTNRGHNSISVFEIDEDKLKMVQNISACGNFPRDILLNENEEYAIIANQKSNNVVIFKRDVKNGMLSKVEEAEIKIEKPSCIVRSS